MALISAAFIALPHGWSWLENGWVIAIVAVLLLVEIVADKVPALDSVNDAIQTFVRPTAGGIVFMGQGGPSFEKGLGKNATTGGTGLLVAYNAATGDQLAAQLLKMLGGDVASTAAALTCGEARAHRDASSTAGGQCGQVGVT